MFRLRLTIGAACLVAVAGLAGCGKDAKDKPKATTASAATPATIPGFTCPLSVGQVGNVVHVPAIVKLADSNDSCEFGIPTTKNGKKSTLPDQKRPIVFLSLLPVATAAMQASAAQANPGAKIKARPDLGRQTFEVTSEISSGSQVRMVSDAGPSSGSWIVSVDLPRSSTAADQALKHAVDLTLLLRNVKAPTAVVGTDPITDK